MTQVTESDGHTRISRSKPLKTSGDQQAATAAATDVKDYTLEFTLVLCRLGITSASLPRRL